MAALFAALAEGFAVAVVYFGVVVAPVIALAPAEDRAADGFRAFGLLQQFERLMDDGDLAEDVSRRAAGVAEWVIGVQIAGDAAVFDDVEGAADDYAGDAVLF